MKDLKDLKVNLRSLTLTVLIQVPVSCWFLWKTVCSHPGYKVCTTVYWIKPPGPTYPTECLQ